MLSSALKEVGFDQSRLVRAIGGGRLRQGAAGVRIKTRIAPNYKFVRTGGTLRMGQLKGCNLMKKIALFNHKGGVGKTTLTVNIAEALSQAGKTVLLVDADPQCNLTAFYMEESALEKILTDSDNGGGETLWSSVKPVVEGRGGIAQSTYFRVPATSIYYLPGDVLLSEYEEVLPEAWTECFARRTRGYDVTTALAQVTNVVAATIRPMSYFTMLGPTSAH